MARRAFEVIDVVEVLQHWHAGRSKAEVAASLGVDRGTVRKYVAQAEAEGLRPGGPPLPRDEWAAKVRTWFPALVDAKARSLTYPEINAHRERIGKLLEDVTVTTAFQRLRDEAGLEVGISSFRRYVALEFSDRVAEAQVTVLRPPVAPGSEAQIDYGYLGQWLDPATQRVRKVWAFVMVLACSRHMFVRPVLCMNQAAWTAAHVGAFEFFNGVPARLVPDNLATGVTKPDLYDPKLNRAYAELASHYGTLIDPARRQKPKDKPRVERPMPYVRDSFWRGRTWEGVAEMQIEALSWCVRVAGGRYHRFLDGAAPHAVFTTVEQPTLRPLPHLPFEGATWSRPKVAPDCHVSVGGVLYSVPWRLIGRRVDARSSERRVEIFSDTALVKTHVRAARGRQTDWGDYPPHKVAFFQRTPIWCRQQAAELGSQVAEVVGGMLGERHLLHHLRAAQGILGLADKYDPARLDAACRRAIEVGDPSYRTIRGILAAGTETADEEEATTPQAPAHLHGPERLFNPDGRVR